MQKYKPYKKTFSHSYAIGIYPVIELLQARPQDAEAIFIAPNSGHSKGVRKIQALCAQHGIPCVEDAKTIARTTRDDHAFAVAVFKKFTPELSATTPHVILVNPDDAGNLGTILRTMLGFGHHDLAIINPAVDVFDPKVVRASMGAVFKQRFRYFSSIGAYTEAYPYNLYPFILQADTTLGSTQLKAPYALVFGNEGSGLPASYAKIGTPVRIEQTNEIDSLNLAVSVSVALYTAFTRK